MLAGTFAAVAPKVGLAVVGPSRRRRPVRNGCSRSCEQLRAQGVDGVFLAGIGPNQGGPPLSASDRGRASASLRIG